MLSEMCDAALAGDLARLYESLYKLSPSADLIFERLVAAKERFAKQCYDLVIADHLPGNPSQTAGQSS